MRKATPTSSPVITVYRKISVSGDRYWYYSGGQPFAMSARIALKEASAGRVKLRTIGHARCA